MCWLGRSTLALSEIITHNSHYPWSIHNITLAKTRLSGVVLTSILSSVGATTHALSYVQSPLKVFLHVTHYLTLSLGELLTPYPASSSWEQLTPLLRPVPNII